MANVPPPYPTPTGLVKGKTMLITAAAGSGIGGALARRAAEEGAILFLSDTHERRLNETADAIAATGAARPHVLTCDVTNEEQVRALIATAIEKLGHIDVLVNNAGLGGNAPIVEMTDDQWFKVIDVTLNSVFRMTRAILPHLYERKAGVIVNNASVLGWRAQTLQSHYAAAKAGVMAFTRCSAMEAAEHGVRINAVSPSFAMHAALSKVTPPGLLEELAGREALGRYAEPWEVANVMLFLASDLSSYMTGEVVAVSSQHP
ncbi:SDR family oxidoreductase [Sphingomonas crocodyli]|uniref:SDR family oxidoreductase n=1 Tax=Sphingomonas crocodyli TaxID=1979270 RepID=A0A437M6C3_9SPHN|nr:SDR family oxidoreductase [Sphingomonas crocodyli]RVT93258.1 SDR family oxidoreductase [Sphingomonas crocodyli]